MERSNTETNPVLLWIPPHRYRPRGITELLLVSMLLGMLYLTACDFQQDDGPDYVALYEVEVADEETFILAVATQEQVAVAEQRLAQGTTGIVHGTVRRGDGGFNGDYDWHLDPETISFPDLAMEVCSGRPMSDVQTDIDYWVDNVKYYCPWSARIVRRVK